MTYTTVLPNSFLPMYLLIAAMEKALLYVDNRELPVAWNKEEMLGSDDEEVEEEEDVCISC